MKLLLNLIVLIVFNCYLVKSSSECSSYINLQSPITTLPCGDSLSNACQNFQLANQSCNIASFDQVTYYFSPGQYNFTNLNTIGYIYNKTVNILNLDSISSSSTSKPTSTSSFTSVIFDLGGALNTFFNINYNLLTNESSIVNVKGITFVNGLQSTSSVLVNYGTSNSVFTFLNCVFDNCKTSGEMGGVISLLGPKSTEVELELVTLNIGQSSAFQNVENPKVSGAFIYAFKRVVANINIDSTEFTSFNVSSGTLIDYDRYKVDSKFTLTNSVISSSTSYISIYASVPTLISNLEYYQNIGGTAILVGGGEYSVLIEKSSFYNNVNSTFIFSSYMDTSVVVNNCTFQNNVLYRYNALGPNTCIGLYSSNAMVSNSQFINNIGSEGPDIYIGESGDSGEILIDSCTFDSSFAQTGGLYISYASMQFKGSNVFKNNRANKGASFYCINSDLLITSDITFTNNSDSSDSDTNGITCGTWKWKDVCSVKGMSNICTDNGASESSNYSGSGSATGNGSNGSNDGNVSGSGGASTGDSGTGSGTGNGSGNSGNSGASGSASSSGLEYFNYNSKRSDPLTKKILKINH